MTYLEPSRRLTAGLESSCWHTAAMQTVPVIMNAAHSVNSCFILLGWLLEICYQLVVIGEAGFPESLFPGLSIRKSRLLFAVSFLSDGFL